MLGGGGVEGGGGKTFHTKTSGNNDVYIGVYR